jgi:acetyl esterase/lipase
VRKIPAQTELERGTLVTVALPVDKLFRMFKRLFLTGLLLGCDICCAAQENPQLAEISVQRDVEYGVRGREKLLLDIYLPAGSSTKPRPAVVLIHGGAWSSLDKGTMRNLASFLASSGFVAVSINYRLLHGSENLWPAQLDDAQRAVRWLRSNSARYGIDASRIRAFGHSAGAQLAAPLGMEDTRDNSDAVLAKYPSRVQAVVDVSGPVDFPAYHYDDNDGGLVNLLGGEYDKIPQVWRDASPVFHVAKSNAPFLIMHGMSDDAVPIAQAQEFYSKLQKAGVPVSFIKLEGGHTFETPEARLRLATETLTFFNHYLVVNP